MMDGDDLGKLGHPIQRVSHDLSREPRRIREQGQTVSIQPNASKADTRSPDDMMRQMGFDPTKKMNPLQFLLAVMNDDLEVIFKNEKRRNRMEGKGGIAMSYRIEAAKTASRYLHMELPKITVSKDDKGGFGDSLSQAINQGNERVRTRRVIIEEVERISPDIPLAPASYPPALEGVIECQDDDDMAEGDMDYDPDAEE